MVPSVRQAIAVLLVVLALGLSSCGGDQNAPTELLEGFEATPTTHPLVGAIAEVSPPERIQQLKPYLDVYEPQVHIVSPRNDETLASTTVTVQLQVRDLPIYKDADLGLGPHLHLFLDDQRYQAVYDPTASIVFENLAPGTHTLRVFASRPWHESFKNEGAYDQVAFNVFTASPNNKPDESQPLLTYSRPEGSYGAEPIMLDFYLTNAPLHEVAQASDTLADWRIRCTVNGESFVFDRWQPIYLKGFQPGTNWLKLEVIDETGNLIENAFNPTIRVIDYTPGGNDGLSRLIRGEIPLAQAKVLVDPNYEPPTPVVEPPVAPAAPAEAAPPEATPAVEATPPPTTTAPTEDLIPAPEAVPATPEQAPAEEPAPVPEAPTAPPLGAPQSPASVTEQPAAETPEPAPEAPAAAAEPSQPAAERLTPASPEAESAVPEPGPRVPSSPPATTPTQTAPKPGQPFQQEGERASLFRRRVTAPSSPTVEETDSLEAPAAEPPSPALPETDPDALIAPSAQEGDPTPNLPAEPPPATAPAAEPTTADAESALPSAAAEPAIEALETDGDII